MRELRTKLDRVDANLSVDVDADTSRAADRIRELSRDRSLSMRVDLDDAEAQARIDELARDRRMNIRADVDSNNAVRSLDRLEGSSRNAGSSLNALSAIRFAGLAAGISALIPLVGGLAAAAGGAVSVVGALAGTAVIGSGGILDAFKASKQAHEGASQAAQKYKDDLDQVRDAQDRVADSQHNEMESLQRVEDAQKAVTDARKEAKDTLDDLNLAVKDGALSERGAELAYRRAVVQLQETRQKAAQGKATSLDVEEAQLGVDRAAQNITDTRVRNQQTQSKAADANAKGVEGSDQVQAAQRQLDQAQYQAQQAATETQKSIRELAKAQEEAAKSANEAAGGSDKFAEAMAKLSPAAQDFVRQMQALGPQWEDLRKAVQENLFSGLGDAVTRLAHDQLPALKDGLSQIATGLNGAIKQTLSSLDGLFTQLEQNGTMQAFINGVNQAMTAMAPLVTGVTSAFIQLGAEIGPHLGPLFSALGTAVSQIAGPLGQLGGVFADTLTSLMPTLTQLINALATGLGPVLPVIGNLLNAIGQALIPLVPPFSQIAQIVGNALVTAINAIAPVLPTIAQAFADVLKAVAPLVEPLAKIIATIAGAVAQNISALATALAPVVEQFAQGLAPVIPILNDAFQKLVPIFAQVAGILGQALAQALQTIMPVLPQLVQAWTDMFIALAPLLPKLAELGAQLLPILADIIVRIAPLVIDLLNAFTSFVNFVVPILIPALDHLKDTIKTGWEVIRGVWDAMQTALDQIHQKFADIVGKIIKLWSDLVDKIDSPFKLAGSAAGKILGTVWDKVAGHADGGYIEGPGTGTSDSIVARLSNGEYVVNAAATSKYRGLIDAINNDSLPGFAEGGAVDPQMKQTSTGQSSIVDSMAKVVQTHFPGMTLTSGVRNSADYHGQGKAADFSDGSDDTPQMQALAGFIAANYPDSLELIHSPFTGNIKNGANVGDGMSTYGAATMAQHRNHVHWAVGSPVSEPQARAAAPSTTVTPAAPSDPSNYSPTGTYVGPSTVDTTKDQAEAANNDLPKEYSLPGVLGKAGELLGQGILGFFGLENSALGSNNPYNRAFSTTVNFYTKKQQDQAAAAEAERQAQAAGIPSTATPSTTPSTTPSSPSTEQPSAPAAPAKHVYDPNGGAEQWRSTVAGVLAATGRSAALADRTLAQIQIESGGNPNATNNYDINAQNGTPSIGLLQVIKPTFDSYMDPRFPGTQSDPEPNIAAALNYVDKRYGGAAQIWPTTAGYAAGGWVTGAGSSTSDDVPAWLSNGEFVVKASAAAANRDWLAAINAGTTRVAPLPAGFGVRGGDSTTSTNRDHSVNFNGDVHLMNVDHLMREQDRWVGLQAQGELATY
ncbi:transglycosylase SLT domain-containing protein [Nocardia nova]|uniref:transglycosylase SLT domain-containing protein n=1 Tax=Nocardia nova TaxID=37330 RepID=UPI002739629D|nr:transglycosylase SLT domain-containing protein [Nocardia nova]